MRAKQKRCTARGNLVRDTDTGAPTEEKLADGQLADHYVLCAEDLAKGYVEPYRHSYVHVGPPGPKYPLRDLTAEEEARWNDGLSADDPERILKYEDYPESERPALGKIWSQGDLAKVANGGCGGVTTMPRKCAETYAAQPGYYGSTFCATCHAYFPVGRDGEFVWDRASMQRVGTRRST
jgi:hypothetical protein